MCFQKSRHFKTFHVKFCSWEKGMKLRLNKWKSENNNLQTINQVHPCYLQSSLHHCFHIYLQILSFNIPSTRSLRRTSDLPDARSLTEITQTHIFKSDAYVILTFSQKKIQIRHKPPQVREGRWSRLSVRSFDRNGEEWDQELCKTHIDPPPLTLAQLRLDKLWPGVMMMKVFCVC